MNVCGRISDDAWRYLIAVIILKEARMRSEGWRCSMPRLGLFPNRHLGHIGMLSMAEYHGTMKPIQNHDWYMVPVMILDGFHSQQLVSLLGRCEVVSFWALCEKIK